MNAQEHIETLLAYLDKTATPTKATVRKHAKAALAALNPHIAPMGDDAATAAWPNRPRKGQAQTDVLSLSGLDGA